MTSAVFKSLDNGVLTLTMNLPQKRNALSEEMMAGLKSALDQASLDNAVRVIVLTATGNTYCAGHDLKEITRARNAPDDGRAYFDQLMVSCSGLMQAIISHRCPVIAQIDGIAAAAGCQLVATCDLAVASTRASFTTPGVHIGLFCSTPMVALSRNISHKHAMEMLLTGDMIDADRAQQVGLVNKVVAPEELQSATMQMAEKIASKSTMTVESGKTAFYQQAELSLADAYKFCSNVMVENMMKSDAREGIGAFVEKRDPKWSDS